LVGNVATEAPAARSELSEALRKSRGAVACIGLFSGLINLLMLTGPLFMLQVYDRVLPSRSLPTLVGLAVLTVCLSTRSRGFWMRSAPACSGASATRLMKTCRADPMTPLSACL
jgi:hypothetical protein